MSFYFPVFKRPLSKKKDDYFLALDIGTEAVKALVFKKGEGTDKKIIISGISSQYLDDFNISDSREVQVGINKKAISRAIEEAKELSLKNLNERFSEKNLPLILTLSPKLLKARIFFQSLNRENPKEVIGKKQEQGLYQKALEKAEVKISQEFAEIYGVLPHDIQFTALKILETKINGYKVSSLLGFSGGRIDFKILAVFSFKQYLEIIKETLKALDYSVFKIVHLAEVLPFFFLGEKLNAVFLDIGGEASQFFWITEGKLERIDDFNLGGGIFSQTLSEILGLRKKEARILKERYSNGELSLKAKKRIREILALELQSWLGSFRDELTKVKSFLPPNCFLLGGASQLPDIKEILTQEERDNVSSVFFSKVRFVEIEKLKNIQNETKTLISPMDIPLLLIIILQEIYCKNGRN
ncbi:hypothetical protein KKB68_00720 [Patescibacteria group bacterium]|nr:hypothetical protein [Patescibacteria group bacterium]